MATPEEEFDLGSSLSFEDLQQETSPGKNAANSLRESLKKEEDTSPNPGNILEGRNVSIDVISPFGTPLRANVNLGKKGEAALVGIGRGMTFVSRGLEQMMNDIPVVREAFDAVGMPLSTDEELAQDTKFYNELLDDPDFGGFALGGEIAGTLTEPVGLAVPALRGSTVAKQISGGAAIGGGFGLVGEVEEGQSRTANTLIGAAAGGMFAPALIALMKTSKALALSGKKHFSIGGKATPNAGGKSTQPNTKGSASVSDRPTPNPRKPSTQAVKRAEGELAPFTKASISNMTGEDVIRGVSFKQPENFKIDNQLWSRDGVLNNYLDEFSGAIDDSFGGYIGKKNDKDLVIMASRLGFSPAEITKSMKQFVGGGKRVRNRKDPSSRFLAASVAQLQINKNAKDAALRYKKTGNQEDLMRWQAHALQQESVRQWVRAGKSELGRSMRILRQVAELDRNPDSLSRFQEIMKELGENDMTKMATEHPELLEAMLSKVTEASSLLQVSKLMRASVQPTLSEKAIFFMLNNMLSNVQTHEVNLLSNAGMQGLGNADKFAEAMLSLPMKNAQRTTFREWAAFTSGQFHGIGKGTRLALNIAMGKAEPATERTKLEMLRRTEIKKALTKDFSKVMPEFLAKGLVGLQDTPGRALVAGDELFKMMTRMGESRAQAVKQAYNHITIKKRRNEPTFKPGSKEFWRFVDNTQNNILENPQATIGKRVEKLAEELTFTEEVGPIGMSVMKHANAHLASKAFLPFVRTTINLMKQGVRHSPAQALRPKMWKDLANGDPKAAAQTMVGSGLYVYGYMLSSNGYLTGSGPVNSALKQERENAGIPPDSFHIKRFANDFVPGVDNETLDKWAKEAGFTDGFPEWVSIQRFDPLGMMFGISADFAELQKTAMVSDKDGNVLGGAEDDNVIKFIVQSFSNNFVDKLYLQSVNDLFQILNPQGDVVGNFERFAKNYLSSLAMSIPVAGSTQSPLAANIARTIDNRKTMRESDPSKDIFTMVAEQNRVWDGIKKQMMDRFPTWKGELRPERNSLGEIVHYGGRPAETPLEKATQFWNPAYTDNQPVSPLKAEVFNLGINIQKPQRKFGDIYLSDEQYDFYLKRQGELIKQTLEPVISSEIELDNLRFDGRTRKLLYNNLTSAQLKKRYTGVKAGDRIKIIKKTVEEAREEAREDLKDKWNILKLPQVRAAAKEVLVPTLRQ